MTVCFGLHQNKLNKPSSKFNMDTLDYTKKPKPILHEIKHKYYDFHRKANQSSMAGT